jgi:hypothetical protein
MSIYKKLLEIQKSVKGLSKDKDSHNYKYVTGNKLLSFIKPLMESQGLLLKQEILSIENTRQDYQIWDKWAKPKADWKPKNEILSKVMMRFTWIDCETGEKDENLFGANGQNDWEKGLGSALTYAERYFLMKYFHISTDEDDIDNPERKPIEEDPKVLTSSDATEPIKLPKMNDTRFYTLLNGDDPEVLRKAFKDYDFTSRQKASLIERGKELVNDHGMTVEDLK